MSLPFLEEKHAASTIMSRRRGKLGQELENEKEAPGSEVGESLKMAMEDWLAAVESKSPIDMAKAFKAAFQLCESEPHEEGEHVEAEQEGA